MSSDLALCDHSMVRPLTHVFKKKAVIMQRRMYARTSRPGYDAAVRLYAARAATHPHALGSRMSMSALWHSIRFYAPHTRACGAAGHCAAVSPIVSFVSLRTRFA